MHRDRYVGIEINTNYTAKIVTISVGPMYGDENKRRVRRTKLNSWEIKDAEDLDEIIKYLENAREVFNESRENEGETERSLSESDMGK